MHPGQKIALFVGVLSALAGAGLIVFLFLPAAPESIDLPPGETPVEETVVDGEGEEPAAPEIPPSGGRETPPAEDTGDTGAEETDSTPAQPTHVLRGRLVTKEVLLPGGSVIKVIGTGKGDDREIVMQGRPDGTFEIDISSFFTGEEDVEEMEVLADHPAYLPAAKQVDAGSPTSRDATPVVFSAELPLVFAGIVKGRVLNDSLKPVEGAHVAVTGKKKGVYHRKPYDRAETGKDGSFRLRAGATGETLLVAAYGGFAPAWAEILATVGEETRADPLVLKPGLSIRGRVSLAGGKPAKMWEVAAHAKGARDSIYVGDAWRVGWVGKTLVLSRATAVTDEEGRYEITGLSPVLHSVRPGGAVWEAAVFTHMSLYQRDDLRKIVEAPAAGVDFEVACSRLHIRVRDGDRPVPNAHVTILYEGGVSLSADDQGHTALDVPPGAVLRILVQMTGFEVYQGETKAPPDGEEATFVVRLQRTRRRLFFTLRSTEGDVPSKATYALFEPGTEADGIFFRSAKVKDGAFFVANPAPGVQILRVRPGDDWRAGLSYWTEAEKQVEIPEAGEVRVVLETKRAGRIRVAARGPDGGFLRAKCVVRDRSGNVLPVIFVVRKRRSSSRSPRLRGEPCMVVPSFAPGHYQLEFSLNGYYAKTVPAEVRAGEITEVDVKLDPE
ncbi:MAG: carboxypeptidase-like regulatory domain-containing protein [Planctomycetota bacterium]